MGLANEFSKIKIGKKNKQNDVVHPTDEKQRNGSLKKNDIETAENDMKPSGFKEKLKKQLKDNILLLLTISSIAVGIGLGKCFLMKNKTVFFV
jgi:hypothetical protein